MPRLNAEATKMVREMTLAQRRDAAINRSESCGWAAKRLVDLNALRGPQTIFTTDRRQYPCGAYTAPSIHQYREAWCVLAVRNARLVLGLERAIWRDRLAAATWNA